MKKLFILYSFAILLLTSLVSVGQTTSVTVTITDGTGQVWFGGTYQVDFKRNSTQVGIIPLLNGVSFAEHGITGILNGLGTFTVVLPDVLQVKPSGGHWVFTLCPNASSSCSVIDTGSLVTGASVNLSAFLSAAVQTPQVFAQPNINRAYKDQEVTAAIGGFYYDATLNCLKISDGVSFTCISAGPISNSGLGIVVTNNGVANLACDGITDDTSGITALLTSVGTSSAKFIFPKGPCLFRNITFPANITLDFSPGGSIQPITSNTAPGSATFVQGVGVETGSSASCVVTITTTGTSIDPSTLVLMAAPYPGFTYIFNNPTDTQGNAFIHVQQSLVGQPRNIGAWIASGVTTSGSNTITITATGTLTNSQCTVHEYKGLGFVVNNDGTGASSNVVANPMSSGAATTTAGSLLIGYGGQPFTTETCTAGAGYIQPAGTAGQTTNGYLCAEYKLSSPGGSQTATQNITSLPANQVYNLLALKPGSARIVILGGIVNPNLRKIFFNAEGTTGHGIIDFTGGTTLASVYPEWWGASPSATATINTPALQAAVWAAFGCGPLPCRINGSGLTTYNRPLYLSGMYNINAELQFYHVINFKVVCNSRLNAGISQGGTNLRIIDGQSIAYGAFYDCAWNGAASNNKTLIDLDYDGITTAGDLRPQFIDFYNNSFFGNNLVDTGVLIAKSGGGAQGSNIYCYDCASSSFTGAAWQIGGNNIGRNVGRFGATNALDIGYTGDIQGCPLYGIAVYSGGYVGFGSAQAMSSMENGFSTQTGYDMYCELTQGPCVMEHVRSESRKLIGAYNMQLKDVLIINQASYLPPGQTFPVGSVMRGSFVGGDGAYYQVINNASAANGVGTEIAPLQASSGTATTIVDTNQTIAGSVTIKLFTSGETVTQAVTGSTGTLLNVPTSLATVTGTNTSGQFVPAEVATQSVTGITGVVQAPTPNLSNPTLPLLMNNLSGTADNNHTWVGGTSGAVYTPNAIPSFSVSNPSMLITVATGAPDNNHNWTGGTSNAVYVPTGIPTNIANWTVNGFVGMLASVLTGANVGCYGVITANTATSITVGAGWITRYSLLPCINPDTTSKFVVEPNWNHGTVVSGGMTMVYMNEDVIGGCDTSVGCSGFQGTLDGVSAPGGKIKPSFRSSVMRNVTTSRQDWYDTAGGDAQNCCDNTYEWDVRVSNTVAYGIAPYLGTYNQNWSLPSITGVAYSGPSQLAFGRRAITWNIGTLGSNGPPANTSANDVWIGGRSDPGAGNIASRNVLEFGGFLGRASVFPNTDTVGTDTDITGGPSTGTGVGGAINFWTSNPGSTGNTTNAGLKRWSFTGAGHLFAGLDNTYDIGASGASRPRDLFLGRNEVVNGNLTVNGTCTGCGAPVVTTGASGKMTVGGLIMQWATGPSRGNSEGTDTTNLLVTCPTAVDNVQLTYVKETAGAAADDAWYQVDSVTTSTVVTYKQTTGGTAASSHPFVFVVCH